MNALIAYIASLEVLEFHENGEAICYRHPFLYLEGIGRIPIGGSCSRRNWLEFLALDLREILIDP